jgi:uncharacterized protein (TIGR02453 family)
MAYFGDEFMRFFEGLSMDNSKAYFDLNRKVYERSVKEPFEDLVAEMIERMRDIDPELSIAPKEAIFRINRDIRFSKDKSPYKVQVSAHISRGGRMDHQYPGLYFHLNHEGGGVGGGVYMVDRDGLERIRARIAREPEVLGTLVEDASFKRCFGKILGEAYKRIPKDLQETYEVQPLVANKQFYFMAGIEPSVVVSDDLADALWGHYLAGKPVADFLADALRG